MTDLAHPDRLAKLEAMRSAGVDPYPARGLEGTAVGDLIAGAGSAEAHGPLYGTTVSVAGRIGVLRDFGKLMFAPLRDRSGQIQIGFQKSRLESWWERRKWLDAGDLLGISGELGRTNKGELTIWAAEVRVLAKAVAPPPEKWHGLEDKELRYRRRYVDLWAHEGVQQVFEKRSRMLSSIRRFLEERGFLEVETPTLHPIAGGATARPFVTHHNALDADLYLRIAPELYLKRLIVGGLERVFEVSRNFRNEGISVRHNPEFTMLELYQAQADYRHVMELTETLFEHLARTLNGSSALVFRGQSYDLKAPFERATYAELFKRGTGVDFHALMAQLSARDEIHADAWETFVELCNRHGVNLGPALAGRRRLPSLIDTAATAHVGHDEVLRTENESAALWRVANELFEAVAEPYLGGPIFVTDYPIQICPLAKAAPENPAVAERFEVYVGGMELANAFSELNDPAEQQRRFEEQVASLDPEAPGEVDLDYVQALEYGMPPAAGLGIGIDRLCMVLTNQDSIRDVLLFPTLRPQRDPAN